MIFGLAGEEFDSLQRSSRVRRLDESEQRLRASPRDVVARSSRARTFGCFWQLGAAFAPKECRVEREAVVQ